MLDCDAAVQQVHELSAMSDLEEFRSKGAKGGGGTDFRPVFEWIKDNLPNEPDAVVYLTDMQGRFPREAPAFPVVWAATTKDKGPFGETVHIDMSRED